MTVGKTSSRGISASAAVTGMLLGALVLVSVLALNAISSARYHRATAEGVLRDYARLAAEQYGQRFTNVLYYRVLNPVFTTFDREGAGDSDAGLIDPSAIHTRAARGEIPTEAAELVEYTFAYDFGTGTVRFSDAGLDEATRVWLRDSLVSHARSIYSTEWPFALVFDAASGSEDFFAYRLIYNDGNDPERAFGFGGSVARFATHFQMASSYGPLLPVSLTGGVERDSLLAIRVTEPGGEEMYRAGPAYVSDLSGSDSLAPNLGRIRITAALVPEGADVLIIGGLPESRVPLLMGLLVVTAGLLVIALIILKREHELSRLRSDFVSGVSHELRTPLAQIRMFAETLMLGRVRNQDEQEKSLQVINRETKRLTQLVDNLLHFSRSERGVAEITLEPTRLGSLIRESIEGFSPLADLHKVQVKPDFRGEVAAQVDPGATQQMILNLLDNALKYGGDGQKVTVGLTESHGFALIWVADEGPGIPEQDRDRVWERFWRNNDKRVSAITGTGIGLSVVRDLATLHGGRVWVTNLKKGARFVIALPISPDAGPVNVSDSELERCVPAPPVQLDAGGAVV